MSHDDDQSVPPELRSAMREAIPPLSLDPDRVRRTVARADLVRGGQGRDAEDIESDARFLVIAALVACIVLGTSLAVAVCT